MNGKSLKWKLVLLLAFILQVIFFNSNLIYGIRLELFWIIFIAIAHNLNRNELAYLGLIFGWLNSIFLIDSTFSLVIFGFILGMGLSKIITKPIWSLVWVRSLFAVTVICIFELFISFSTIDAGVFWLQFGLFTVVHLVAAVLAASLIIDNHNE